MRFLSVNLDALLVELDDLDGTWPQQPEYNRHVHSFGPEVGSPEFSSTVTRAFGCYPYVMIYRPIWI